MCTVCNVCGQDELGKPDEVWERHRTCRTNPTQKENN